MCTAVSVFGKNPCFGRNLDLEYSYGEEVVLLPRGFHLPFRGGGGPGARVLAGV